MTFTENYGKLVRGFFFLPETNSAMAHTCLPTVQSKAISGNDSFWAIITRFMITFKRFHILYTKIYTHAYTD